MSTRKDRMYDQIHRHGENLHAIFPKTKKIDPVALCKRLLRLENEAHRMSEARCNDYSMAGEDMLEAWEGKFLKRLDAVLGFKAAGVPVFVNTDPRGYALKIDDEYVRAHGLRIHTDMGG